MKKQLLSFGLWLMVSVSGISAQKYSNEFLAIGVSPLQVIVTARRIPCDVALCHQRGHALTTVLRGQSRRQRMVWATDWIEMLRGWSVAMCQHQLRLLTCISSRSIQRLSHKH